MCCLLYLRCELLSLIYTNFCKSKFRKILSLNHTIFNLLDYMQNVIHNPNRFDIKYCFLTTNEVESEIIYVVI